MIILIADDDRLIRFMMKSMLNEILTLEYTILEAVNGREMVEICKRRQPDIVFADIKMPYMSGIEAIEECRKYSEDTAFVIISGYSEFEYAQKALKLGVFDYLLKPVEEEQLASILEKLKGRIENNKKEINSRFQLKVLNAFNYFSTVGTDGEYEEEHCIEGKTYEVIGVRTRSSKQNSEYHMGFQKEMIEKMNCLGKQFVETGDCYAHVYSAEGTPYFVFETTAEGKEKILSYVKKLSLKSRNDKVVYHFLYFSNDSLAKVCRLCEENDEFEGIVMNFSTGELIDVEEILLPEKEEEVLKYTDKLLDAWERADSVFYKEALNNMYRKYKDENLNLRLKEISQYCSMIMQQEIKAETFKDFCRSFVTVAERMYVNVESDDSDIITKVKSYVEKYYMNDISIGQIAEDFEITPNYLSTIFHQKAGCKFVDYLTEVRIANAKRLLIQNKTASVKDIAVMVGYNSSRYFATLFQKVVGIKPSIYRKENIEI